MDTCASALSLLPKIEPLTATAVAICLAYLNLERFRYRSAIRKYAQEIIRQYDENTDYKNLSEHSNIQFLKRLASLDDHEHIATTTGTNNSSWTGWGYVYSIVFEKHRDRKIILAGVSIALLLLCLGVSHDIGHIVFLSCLFSSSIIIVSYYISLFLIFVPITLVLLGQTVVDRAKKKADGTLKDIEITMQALAKKAKMPTSP